jgi:phosphoglycerol transferase MdoB-like AlkP superfamily enzyme
MMHIDLFSYQLDISSLWEKDVVVALLGIALVVSLALANRKGESIMIQAAMMMPVAFAIHALPHVNYISINDIFNDVIIAIGISLVFDYITTKKERPDLKYRFINVYILLTLYAIIKYHSNAIKFALDSLIMIPVLVLLTLIPSDDEL